MAGCTDAWGTTSAVTYTGVTFQQGTTVTGATTFTNCVWGAWIGQTAAITQNTWNVWTNQVYVRKETRREAAARRRREREEAARLEAQMRERGKAEQRAEKLLIEHLTEEQQNTLAVFNYFDVKVGERIYRIRRGTHGNVRLVDEAGIERVSYCIQPPGVPAADAMLAQKLHLEANEQEFLRVANARPM